MRQSKNTKRALTHVEVSLRAFIFSIFLIGNVFILISTVVSNPIFAQGIVRDVSSRHLVAQKPLAVVSTQNREQSKGQIASHGEQEQTGHWSAPLRSISKTSARVAAPLNLDIAVSIQGGPTFQVGQTFTFNVNITNISSNTTIDSTSGLTTFGIIPLGLSNIAATGSGWTVNTSGSTSPATIAANYVGAPVGPGAGFAPITVIGILNSNAVPVFTGTLGVSDNNIPSTALTTFSVNVSPVTQTPTVTPTSTVTPIVNSELGISLNVHGGPTFQVGQTLTFDVNITNISSTQTLDSTSNVTLANLVPLGLSNIVTTGSNWIVIATAANGPIVIEAVYSGPPIAPGGAFPPFEISGTLNANASPMYINNAGVGDINEPSGVTTTFNVSVSPASTVTPTPTPMSTVTPTVTPTASPTPMPTVTPTVSPTPMPTVSPTPMPTVTPIVIKPQLYMVNSHTGGNIYHIGQMVNYNLVVTNLPSSLAENQPITVYDVFPVGLNNMVVSASNDWTISMSSATSPTLITARYNGLYPVVPGTVLPLISISGDLTEAAVPSFTSNATVHSTDDPNPSLNTSIDTIVVLESILTPTPTPAPTPGSAAKLAIVNTTTNGDHFKVGEKVNYVVVVSSDPSGGPIPTPDSFFVSYMMPLGISEIEVKGDHWRFSISDHSSPILITAQYMGSYPIKPGTSLPAITITGELNKNAVPSFTTTALVNDSVLDRTSEEGAENDDSSSYTVFVKKDSSHHHQNVNGNNNHNNHQGKKNDGSLPLGSGSNSSSSDGTGNSNGNNSNGNNSNGNNSGSGIIPLLPATGDSPIVNEF